jgi:hypothetical protein
MAGISLTTSEFCRAHCALANAPGTNSANFPTRIQTLASMISMVATRLRIWRVGNRQGWSYLMSATCEKYPLDRDAMSLLLGLCDHTPQSIRMYDCRTSVNACPALNAVAKL